MSSAPVTAVIVSYNSRLKAPVLGGSTRERAL
jgi:hypothetical protein